MSYFLNADIFVRDDMSDIPHAYNVELPDGTPAPRVGEVVFFDGRDSCNKVTMGTVKLVVHTYDGTQGLAWLYAKCVVFRDE